MPRKLSLYNIPCFPFDYEPLKANSNSHPPIGCSLDTIYKRYHGGASKGILVWLFLSGKTRLEAEIIISWYSIRYNTGHGIQEKHDQAF